MKIVTRWTGGILLGLAVIAAGGMPAASQTVIGGTQQPEVQVDRSVLDQLGPPRTLPDELLGVHAPSSAAGSGKIVLHPPREAARAAHVARVRRPLKTEARPRTTAKAKAKTAKALGSAAPKPKARPANQPILSNAAPPPPPKPEPATKVAPMPAAPPAPKQAAAPPPPPPPAAPEKSHLVAGADFGQSRQSGAPPRNADMPQMPAEPAPPAPPATREASVAPVAPAAPTPSPGATSSGGTTTVLFDPDGANLSDQARGVLTELAHRATADPALQLQLLAYASGDEENSSKARRLSLSRALAVRSFLIDQGIHSTRIEVRALGNKVPGGPPDRVDLIEQKH